MEEAPLSLAHSHARNAVLETRKANPIAASEEHDLAAGEFANAAKSTSDTEALRILRLLEQQHLRLAEIFKAKPDEAQSFTSLSNSDRPSDSLAEASTSNPQVTVQVPASDRSEHPGSQFSHQTRREPSSSIAKNLATARGIPPGRRRTDPQSLAQVSTQTAEGRVVNPKRRGKHGEIDDAAAAGGEKTSSTPQRSHPSGSGAEPDGTRASNVPGLPPPIATASTEEPFSRFYSTFNNFITTLSAPLAFAGLPLNPAEPSTPPSTKSPPKPQTQQTSPLRPSHPASRATADPDLTRLFSRAALRAVREEHGFGPPAESFYVVPTTGGTMSYAGMLANARQASNLTDDDPEPEFVDARETPTGSSPIQSRYSRHRRSGSGNEAARRPPAGSNQTWEELAVENETLKTVVFDLGDRLRAFELGAQKSSLALHASMRQFSSPTASMIPGGKVPPLPGSAASPLPGMGAATKQLEDRIRELEDELKAVKKDNRKLARENQKYLGVIEKYRERWEALKEGARERVKGGSTGGGPVESLLREDSKDSGEA